MTACPDREMALHALIDGELNSLAVVELEHHLRGCAACRAAFGQLETLRGQMAQDELRFRAPTALRQKIEATLPDSQPRTARPSALPWLGGGIAGALAASLAMLLLPQQAAPTLADELVANHIRSQQLAHLTDIAASDRHIVRPWFSGKVNFSPPVPDLAADGFTLAGGRLDVIGGSSVASLVYKRRRHSLNLFIRPLPPGGSRKDDALTDASFHLIHWSDDGLEFWAVSDLDANEMSAFKAAFRRATDVSH